MTMKFNLFRHFINQIHNIFYNATYDYDYDYEFNLFGHIINKHNKGHK